MNIKIIPPHVEYASSLHQWRNESLTLKFNPVQNRSLEELQEMLRKAPTTLTPLDKSVPHRWFIEISEETRVGTNSELAGTVSLAEINGMMGLAEIGYMVGSAHHGRGIATMALKLWTTMIFEQTDLRKLTASVSEQNAASIRVLEKAGYKKEGLLREHYMIQGKPTNEVIFGLLRSEWV